MSASILRQVFLFSVYVAAPGSFFADGSRPARHHVTDICVLAAKTIPLGTKVEVEFKGGKVPCVVKYRLPQTSKADFDLLVLTKSEAIQFGIQSLKVTIRN